MKRHPVSEHETQKRGGEGAELQTAQVDTHVKISRNNLCCIHRRQTVDAEKGTKKPASLVRLVVGAI